MSNKCGAGEREQIIVMGFLLTDTAAVATTNVVVAATKVAVVVVFTNVVAIARYINTQRCYPTSICSSGNGYKISDIIV